MAVSLFCGFVVPAILKLRKGKQEEKQLSDERADKGYQYVIAQQKADKDSLVAALDEKETELKTTNDKFTEAVRLAERFKTQWENADAEIKRLRDECKELTIQITEQRKEIERLKDHEKTTKQQIEKNNEGIARLEANLPTDPK